MSKPDKIYRSMMARLLLCLGLVLPGLAHADLMMMIRSHQTFPEAMALLQEAIKETGYTVSRVQRVDIGLTKSGYKTDKYRVVFFGKPAEIRDLTARYPELQAFLPLKISIFAEGNDTIIVTANPQHLKRAGDAKLQKVINRWEKDISRILTKMRKAD
ncbi:MAG: DUF302 domain-containing protein [Gammaproteobacteria bacterium]|nr:DUF302 domain-containing protein [Gammaproteobacteria bacterium]MDH5650343.1 DUF302 domain-containing protein [Gammaproteobacteria bacterium]